MGKEKLYVGTKIIKAVPMNKYTYYIGYKGIECTEENEDGYKVEYPDGYVSWSPAKTFEICYRNVTKDELEMIGEGHV